MAPYESPTVTELGSLDELTLGHGHGRGPHKHGVYADHFGYTGHLSGVTSTS